VTATATPSTQTPTSTATRTASPTVTAHSGATVWLTGLPSSGKSTIADAVAAALRTDGHRVEVLDGDAVRETLSAGLGFGRADRETNIDRIGFVADLLARNGVLVLAAVISPYAAARDRVRARHARSGAPFLEVHVATPVETCAARDVKGLYALQARGDLVGLTGVDDAYEAPVAPELRVDTRGRPVRASAAEVLALLRRAGVLR
jgi:adenylylsulfate kinase